TLGSIAIDVKTSSLGDPRTIRISSLDQMEKVTEKLYLLHITVSPTNDSMGLTMKMMHQRCLDLVSNDLVAEAHYAQKISDLYGKASKAQLDEKLHITGIHLYEVDEGFPVITRQDVNHGIASAQYDIFISSIKGFEVIENIKEIIKNG
ncbi:MAG: hypothetical protein DRR42_24390, partial [Gammaproteobacteria bacterium]